VSFPLQVDMSDHLPWKQTIPVVFNLGHAKTS
jgi:hypothetical protein